MYLRDLYIEMLSHCKGTFGSWISEIINIFLHKFLEALLNVTVWRLESIFYLEFLRIFAFPYHFLAGVVFDLQGCFGEGAIVGETPISLLQIDFNLRGFFIASLEII